MYCCGFICIPETLLSAKKSYPIMKGVVNIETKMEKLLERMVVLMEIDMAVKYTDLAVESGEITKKQQPGEVEKILDRYSEIFGEAYIADFSKRD